MNTPSVIVKDLVVKTQEKTVLDGISFTLQPEQQLAISGNSESGKTLLAKALSGKIHFSGQISFHLQKSAPVRVELVEQRYSFKNLSGISEFYYQQRFNSFDSGNAPTVFRELLKTGHGTNSKNQTESAESILKVLGIAHLKNSSLIRLSSGEHKRFQLAKALLNQPQLLILDSPYTALDVSARKELNQILEEISKKGIQIILIAGTFPIPDFITHVAFLEDKKLCFFGEKKYFDPGKFISLLEDHTVFPHELLSLPNASLPSDTIVEMKNISLKYDGNPIFQKLNWKVTQGERWLLKGRNGAGKSSLLSLITGDHPQAYSNEIYLFGKRRGSGESIWDIKQKTGYISPELHACFDRDVTCFNAIGSGYFDTIGLFKKLDSIQYNNILQWLDFLQLSHVSNKPLHSVSSGLQRMILLARALVKNPPLLILDEPCQGLDQKQSDQFVSLINHICSFSFKTLIYVSHDERNVPQCVERVLHLEKEGHEIYSINNPAALAVA